VVEVGDRKRAFGLWWLSVFILVTSSYRNELETICSGEVEVKVVVVGHETGRPVVVIGRRRNSRSINQLRASLEQ
jgi:hypothetical protein